jgi:transposase
MNKPTDARSLSEESLELLRRQAHRLRQDGRVWSEIAQIVGVHQSTVMSWARRFNVGGEKAPTNVSSARRGRRVGEKRTISLLDENPPKAANRSSFTFRPGPGTCLRQNWGRW